MARDKIVAGPCGIYVAARGTAKPTPAPSLDLENLPTTLLTNWSLLAAGDYGSAVENNFSESKNDVRGLNDTYKLKKFRSEEGILYSTTLLDLLPDTLAYGFDNQDVETTMPASGVAGYQELDFERGFNVVEHAILVVGMAPFALTDPNDAIMVFWHPAVDIEAPGSFNRNLADPTMPALMADVIKHETLGVGGLVANNADPL